MAGIHLSEVKRAGIPLDLDAGAIEQFQVM